MSHEGDEFDLWLSWAIREFVPDKDPPPRVLEAIEAKLALEVSRGEVRPLAWRSKASAWLRQALSSVQAVVWAHEQPTPAYGVTSISAAPWPLHSFHSHILIVGFQARREIST